MAVSISAMLLMAQILHAFVFCGQTRTLKRPNGIGMLQDSHLALADAYELPVNRNHLNEFAGGPISGLTPFRLAGMA